MEARGARPDSITALDANGWVEVKAVGAKLGAFPRAFCRLAGLLSLNLTNNELRALPDEFSSFASLQTLNLSLNRFTTFPKPVLALRRIVLLDLSSNGLLSVPPEIRGLSALRTLMLGRKRGSGRAGLAPALRGWSVCGQRSVFSVILLYSDLLSSVILRPESLGRALSRPQV